MSENRVGLRRIYDAPQAEDGRRVLIDGLWPRGLAKADAPIDEWCRDVAPSAELRKWYGHQPARFAEFVRRYRDELADGARAAALEHLRELRAAGALTLVTATKAVDISHARVLVDLLEADGTPV